MRHTVYESFLRGTFELLTIFWKTVFSNLCINIFFGTAPELNTMDNLETLWILVAHRLAVCYELITQVAFQVARVHFPNFDIQLFSLYFYPKLKPKLTTRCHTRILRSVHMRTRYKFIFWKSILICYLWRVLT